jgi:hypothetical protein
MCSFLLAFLFPLSFSSREARAVNKGEFLRIYAGGVQIARAHGESASTDTRFIFGYES